MQPFYNTHKSSKQCYRRNEDVLQQKISVIEKKVLETHSINDQNYIQLNLKDFKVSKTQSSKVRVLLHENLNSQKSLDLQISSTQLQQYIQFLHCKYKICIDKTKLYSYDITRAKNKAKDVNWNHWN